MKTLLANHQDALFLISVLSFAFLALCPQSFFQLDDFVLSNTNVYVPLDINAESKKHLYPYLVRRIQGILVILLDNEAD